jgi:hypothetical protein
MGKSINGNGMKKKKTGSQNHFTPTLAPERRGSEGGERKRPPFERMKKIFGLLQDGKYPNCSTVAAEFEVSPKRRGGILISCATDGSCRLRMITLKFGFYFTKPVEPVSRRASDGKGIVRIVRGAQGD